MKRYVKKHYYRGKYNGTPIGVHIYFVSVGRDGQILTPYDNVGYQDMVAVAAEVIGPEEISGFFALPTFRGGMESLTDAVEAGIWDVVHDGCQPTGGDYSDRFPDYNLVLDSATEPEDMYFQYEEEGKK